VVIVEDLVFRNDGVGIWAKTTTTVGLHLQALCTMMM